MDGNELLFILMVLSFFGLFLYKLANVFSVGKLYGDLISWLSFIAGGLVYGMGFLLSIVMAVEFLYVSIVYQFVSAFFVLFVLLHFFEVLFTLAARAVGDFGPREVRSRGFR